MSKCEKQSNNLKKTDKWGWVLTLLLGTTKKTSWWPWILICVISLTHILIFSLIHFTVSQISSFSMAGKGQAKNILVYLFNLNLYLIIIHKICLSLCNSLFCKGSFIFISFPLRRHKASFIWVCTKQFLQGKLLVHNYLIWPKLSCLVTKLNHRHSEW